MGSWPFVFSFSKYISCFLLNLLDHQEYNHKNIDKEAILLHE